MPESYENCFRTHHLTMTCWRFKPTKRELFFMNSCIILHKLHFHYWLSQKLSNKFSCTNCQTIQMLHEFFKCLGLVIGTTLYFFVTKNAMSVLLQTTYHLYTIQVTLHSLICIIFLNNIKLLMKILNTFFRYFWKYFTTQKSESFCIQSNKHFPRKLQIFG